MQHENTAGIISAGQNLFSNSPDTANVYLQSNSSANNFVTLVTTAYLNAQIIGVPNANRYFCAPTTIDHLDSDEYQLKKAIPLTLEQVGDDEWLATFADAEVARSGDTPHDAVEWLRSSVVQLFHLYRSETALGPLPTKQFEALGRYIVEKSD